MTPNEYERMKRQLDDLSRQRDKAAGALEQLKSQLAEEFGCKTTKEGKLLAKQLLDEKVALQETIDKLQAGFQTKYGHLLEGMR